MGASLLIGLSATVSFAAFLCLRGYGMTLISLPFLYNSLVGFLLAIASLPGVNLPLILGKRSDGTFPLWSILLFSPFLMGVRIFGFLRRWRSREPPYNEVCEGLYVGGWPSSLDRVPPGTPAIIDCTCELPRISALSGHPYICIPTWDTRSPHPSEIESAVRWALRMRSQKRPVYIHCAYGHGRSVALACAVLVRVGVAEDWKQAEKIIRERRRCIRMNALHRRTLEEWSKFRLSPKANGESDLSSVIRSSAS